MPFSHDTVQSLRSVVELVNSGRGANRDEQLANLDSLSDFVARHDVSEVTRLTLQDLYGVRDLRGRVRAVFDAGDDLHAAQAINALVAKAVVVPRLTDHDGHGWHMHYFCPGASLTDHLAVSCGMALAQVIGAGERERLRTCAAPDCDNVLVDLSRNRSKRYCDARTCGNRLHVAAYRERRRGQATG